MTAPKGRLDREIVPFAIGDKITMRKAHPCGGNEWSIYRVGADIGLRCATCDRRVMLDRWVVQRRMTSRVPAEET